LVEPPVIHHVTDEVVERYRATDIPETSVTAQIEPNHP
jgi:hypothetical protein